MAELKKYEAPSIEQLGGSSDVVIAGAPVALPLPVVVVVVGPAVVVI